MISTGYAVPLHKRVRERLGQTGYSVRVHGGPTVEVVATARRLFDKG